MESGGGGGQTAKEPSSWTVGMLKEHVIAMISLNDKRYEERFIGQVQAVNAALAAQEKAVNAALVAAEKAVQVAETNAAEWRKGANEWRQAMTDREVKFVGTTEFNMLKERVDTSGGKAIQAERSTDTRQASNANVIALASVIAGVIGVLIGAAISFLNR
jgi:hypothetical protein